MQLLINMHGHVIDICLFQWLFLQFTLCQQVVTSVLSLWKVIYSLGRFLSKTLIHSGLKYILFSQSLNLSCNQFDSFRDKTSDCCFMRKWLNLSFNHFNSFRYDTSDCLLWVRSSLTQSIPSKTLTYSRAKYICHL